MVGAVARFAIMDTFPLLPSCTCAERAGESMSSLFMLYKKIFYPRVLVVSSVCCVFALLQNIQYCLACPSVCVLLIVCLCLRFLFVFSRIQTPSACFLFIPSLRQVLAAVALWSLAMCWVEDRAVSLPVPVHPSVVLLLLLLSAESLPSASPCVGSPPRGRRSCQSLSMSLYFLRRMETWSLNRTGSSLIWEWTSGMAPNQLANLFMQVCRWAKWSGSAQREALEDWWEWRRRRGEKTKQQF